MARSGPKPLADGLKVVKGTFQPCRRRTQVVTTLDGEITQPTWLKGEALKIWLAKVAIYTRRGQTIVGLEGTLAQYCALEADLIRRWRQKVEIPVAMINAHRLYANEFYDTPASQQGPVTQAKKNTFAGNGRRSDPAPA